MRRSIERRALLKTACSGAALLCLAGCQGPVPAQGEKDGSEPEKTQADAVVEPTATASADMPFSLDGIPADGDVLQAEGGSDPAGLAGEWTFGGDYAQIGSFPIDGRTVFGSATDNASDVSSYVAALIGPDSTKELESPQEADSDTFFEPQDGSGNANLVVWRCSELSNLPTAGTDNWQIRCWDAVSGKTRTIASAQALNSRPDTPMLDAEVVPTTNGEKGFFASMHREDDSWKPVVLACDLNGSGDDATVMGAGNYPAACGQGTLWASLEDSDADLCTRLMRWEEGSSTRIFSLESEGHWGISGVWSNGSFTAVGFSSSDSGQGSYVGIWRDNFSSLLCWVYTDAPRVLWSLNSSWFVWGAGSEADNADMYALNLGSRQILFLGNAPGYSRPTIAQDSDAVMVPVTNGMKAVSFRVGMLD